MPRSISFILVDPGTPGNIGAAARALKTMGFSDLRLVNSSGHLDKEARKLAYGAHDILESVRVYPTLQEALRTVDFAIATTARERTVFHDYLTPEQALEVTREKEDTVLNVALVFGREESGLTTNELQLCDIRSSIPMVNTYPSLNLGQSVMLYAYIFSDVPPNEPWVDDKGGEPGLEYKVLKERTIELLDLLGVSRNENLYRRMLERMGQANKTDVHLLLSLHRYLMKQIEKY